MPNRAVHNPGTLAEINPAQEYQELVDSLDDIVFRFDDRGLWSYLSPAWSKRLGWDPLDCIGRAAAKFVHSEDRAKVLRNWTEVMASRQQSFRGEVRFKHFDGSIRWMLVSARGLRDPNGSLRGVTGTLTDVSAAKATEAALIAAHAAAEAANRSKSEFLSTMSHELRTPLNAVIGLSESLLERGAPFDPARTERYLGIIQASGRQLLAQINDILDLVRIDAGNLKMHAEQFDARELCADLLPSGRADIRAKQLQTSVVTPPEPLLILGDARLLRQVLQNLVSNAVKFTEKGGRVSVTLERLPSGSVRFSVADTGIGIPKEKLGVLFKPFSQVDSSAARRFGGTGLGLALVDRIVRLHRGSVSVETEAGRGSTFAVEVPGLAPVAPTEAATRPPRSRRVVLVDDDSHHHTLVGDFLRRRGFDVISCETAMAALAEIGEVEPGFAIVDVNMAGMTGLELITRLRQSPNGRNLPIIAVTALAASDDAERCRAAGADAYLPKPISLAALVQRIESLTRLSV